MLKEVGRVLAIDDDALWVETINRSTCGSCQARSGCGQSVLSRWMSRASHIRVLVERDAFAIDSIAVDDQVEIGIGDAVVVQGSLLVYLLPLVTLMLGAWLGHSVAPFGSIAVDLQSIFGSVLGFAFGGFLVRLHARRHRFDTRIQPVLLEHFPKAFDGCIASSRDGQDAGVQMR